jgi:hypothetical protein
MDLGLRSDATNTTAPPVRRPETQQMRMPNAGCGRNVLGIGLDVDPDPKPSATGVLAEYLKQHPPATEAWTCGHPYRPAT